MTLNEAIEHAKEKAAELRERNCIECAVEHEQLATWLEELSKFQWIPVTERMPQEHQIVVGWTKDNPFSCYREEVVTWNGKGWVFVYAQRYVTNVKYWMPLPEPYTAKAEDDDNARRVKPLEFDRFENDTLKDTQPTVPAHWEKADIPLPYQVRTIPMPNGTFAHREMYVCSECDGYNDRNTQYCPHCGARMDRKDGERMKSEHPCEICTNLNYDGFETECVWKNTYSEKYECCTYGCMMNREGSCLGGFYDQCGAQTGEEEPE